MSPGRHRPEPASRGRSEVAKYEAETARMRMIGRQTQWSRVIDLLRWPFVLAASYIPATQITKSVDAVAGKTTKFDVNIVVSITITLSVTVVYQAIRIRSQNKDLKRQREEIEQLKVDVDSAKKIPAT